MPRHSSQALSLSAYLAERLGPPSQGKVVAGFHKGAYVELPGGLLFCIARPEVEDGALTLRAPWPPATEPERKNPLCSSPGFGGGLKGIGGLPGAAWPPATRAPLAPGFPVEWDGRDLSVHRTVLGDRSTQRAWRIRTEGVPRWSPAPLRWINPAQEVRARLAALGASLAELAPGAGLAPLVGEAAKGRVPPAARIPTDEGRAGVPRLESLLRGLEAGDAEAVGRSLSSLLGLGSGLTPAWDDFLGGMALGLRAGKGVEPSEQRGNGPAECLGEVLSLLAPRLTHPISAAHLAAAAGGFGRASQHALLHQLLDGPDPSGDLPAALRATRSGHTSGWDSLAGLFLGLSRSLA